MNALVPYVDALSRPDRVRSFDTETALIGPGLLAPPLACLTTARIDLSSTIHHWAEDAEQEFEALLTGPTILSLNAAYDLAVGAAQYGRLFELVFDALKNNRVIDVGLAWMLRDIAYGELGGRAVQLPEHLWKKLKGKVKKFRWVKHLYSVAGLSKRLWDEDVEKDEFRLTYGEWRKRPLREWSDGAKRYAQYDAVLHMKIGQALAEVARTDERVAQSLDNVYAQTRAAFFLHLMACRGIRTDGEHCKLLVRECEVELERCKHLIGGLQHEFKYARDFEPLVRVGERNPVTGRKWKEGSKDQKIARSYMLGALLRGVGADDTTDARADLLDRLRHVEPNRFDEAYVELDSGVELKLTLTEGGAGLLREKGDELTRDEVEQTISLGAQQCRDTADPIMLAYATYTSANTLRKRVQRLSLGARMPLQPRYNVLMETGRTSCSMPTWPLVGDNVQNFRRKALKTEEGNELPGMRECIIARPGFKLCSVDLDNAEMRGEAQIEKWVLGRSTLADILNSGKDCHAALAAEHLLDGGPIAYEDFAKRRKAEGKGGLCDIARQFAKIPNFALLGGAVGATMIAYAKQSDIVLDMKRALQLERAFHAMWPEVSEIHALIREAIRESDDGLIAVQQFVSSRWRGGCRYTVARNGLFQALVGDAAKAAGLPLAEECYIRTTSPLYGSYPIIFAHDEYIAEIPIGRNTTAAAWRMRDVILEAVAPYFPDVPMTAKPCLMDRWYKDAELVERNGEIISWQPEPKKLSRAA